MRKRVNLILGTKTVQIIALKEDIEEIRKATRIRYPDAFYKRKQARGSYNPDRDFKYFITVSGSAQAGYFKNIYLSIKKLGYKIDIEDKRPKVETYPPTKEYPNGYKLRSYQKRLVRLAIESNVDGIPLNYNTLPAATNAGKTIIMAELINRYRLKTAVLYNSKENFKEAYEGLSALLPGRVGYIASDMGPDKDGDVIIIMVQTLTRRLEVAETKKLLGSIKLLLVDECDLSANKTYTKIMKSLSEVNIAMGLSGTTTSMDVIKRGVITSYLGCDIEGGITGIELRDKHKVSSLVHIEFHKGNSVVDYDRKSYSDLYNQLITNSDERNEAIMDVVETRIRNKQYPIFVTVAYQEHVKVLYRKIKKKFPGLSKAWVHHEKPNRNEVIDKFKRGKIQILVGSKILWRAKNFPLMITLINASANKGATSTKQIYGRISRKHPDHLEKYYDDFNDLTKNFEQASKKRKQALRMEGYEIIDNKHSINEKLPSNRGFKRYGNQ